MPPGFLLRASTISTSIATTTHHLILVLGLCLSKVLPIPHQQFSLSLEQILELDLWLCQSAVAHLLRSEDEEQLKAGQNCHRAPTTPDAPETLLLQRRSFCGVICVTATNSHCFPPHSAGLGISSLDYLSSVGRRGFGDKAAKVFPSLQCFVSHQLL